jgi:hypothetical protein
MKVLPVFLIKLTKAGKSNPNFNERLAIGALDITFALQELIACRKNHPGPQFFQNK